MTSGRESYWLFSVGKSLIYQLRHLSQGNKIMYFLKFPQLEVIIESAQKLAFVSKRKSLYLQTLPLEGLSVYL